MKVFQLFLKVLLIKLVSSKKLSQTKEKKLFSKAFQDVIQELYIDPKIKFKIIIYENVSLQVLDIIDSVQKRELLTQIVRLKNDQVVYYPSSIIFCESLKEVTTFFSYYVGLDGMNFAQHFRFLFYVHQPFNETQIDFGKLSWEYGRTT